MSDSEEDDVTVESDETEAVAHYEGEGYSFEDVDTAKLRAIRSDRLLTRVTKVIAAVQGAGATSDYLTERRRYIGLNKVLNERGYIAPRFRPSLRQGKHWGEIREPIFNLISNDHQVLDLHWLHHQAGFDAGRDRSLPERWQGLFAVGFDLSLAQRLIGTGGNPANKIDILGLTPAEQLQLRVIRSDAVRKWWERHRDEWKTAEQLVRQAARTRSRLRNKERAYADAWLAARCAEYVNLPQPVCYRLISGEVMKATTLSNAKGEVEKLMKVARSTRPRAP